MRRTIGVITVIFCLIGAALLSTKVLFGEERVIRVGVLSQNDDRIEKVQGLKDGMRSLGYIEGQTVVYDILNAYDDPELLDQLADQLAAQNYDVLVAAGAGETRSLKKATDKQVEQTPVIFMGTLSPTSIGLLENEAFPESNITGINNYHYELTVKRLELFKHLIPDINNIAVIGDPRTTCYQKLSQDGSKFKGVAEYLGIDYQLYGITKPTDIGPVFEQIARQGQAVLILPGSFIETVTEDITASAKSQGLPVFGVYPDDVQKGCIAAYGTGHYDLGVQSANMVHKVLRGYPPSAIPVEITERIIFKVNLGVAQDLRINLSATCLCLADEVIGQEG